MKYIYIKDKRISSFKKEVENFEKLIISFFKGKDSLTNLVLQTVKMDELNNNIIETTQYSISMVNIEKIINEGLCF